MKRCEKCQKPAKEPVTLIIKGEKPEDVGTNLTLCRPCGVAATVVVGEWLASDDSEFVEISDGEGLIRRIRVRQET